MTRLEKNKLDKQSLIRKLECFQEKTINLSNINIKKQDGIKNLNMDKKIFLEKEKKKLYQIII